MRAKLTLYPVARSRSASAYETGAVFRYRVDFDPLLPGYVAFIENLSAADHSPRWKIHLSINGVQQDYPAEYRSAIEALAELQQGFEGEEEV